MALGTLMDMSPVVTNEVDHPCRYHRLPATNAIEHPSMAIRLTALIVDFIAHQPPALDRTPGPSPQRRVAIFTAP